MHLVIYLATYQLFARLLLTSFNKMRRYLQHLKMIAANLS